MTAETVARHEQLAGMIARGGEQLNKLLAALEKSMMYLGRMDVANELNAAARQVKIASYAAERAAADSKKELARKDMERRR
jgi:hypothetical protein